MSKHYQLKTLFEKFYLSIAVANGRTIKFFTEVGSTTSLTSGAGMLSVSPFGQNAASTIRDSREREKKEMSDLNDRLATYIEKVS